MKQLTHSLCRKTIHTTQPTNELLGVTSSTTDVQHVWTLKCEPAGGKTAVGHAVTFPTDAQRATCGQTHGRKTSDEGLTGSACYWIIKDVRYESCLHISGV